MFKLFKKEILDINDIFESMAINFFLILAMIFISRISWRITIYIVYIIIYTNMFQGIPPVKNNPQNERKSFQIIRFGTWIQNIYRICVTQQSKEK